MNKSTRKYEHTNTPTRLRNEGVKGICIGIENALFFTENVNVQFFWSHSNSKSIKCSTLTCAFQTTTPYTIRQSAESSEGKFIYISHSVRAFVPNSNHFYLEICLDPVHQRPQKAVVKITIIVKGKNFFFYYPLTILGLS